MLNIGVTLAGLSEAIKLLEKGNIDTDRALKAIRSGAAQSWQMDNRALTMDENHYEHGFAVNWMRKDLGICLSTAERLQATLPLTALVDQFYKDVQAIGGGRWDTSALLARIQHLQGEA